MSVSLAASDETPKPEAPAADRFDDFDDTQPNPTAAALRQLLSQVPGESFDISEAKKYERSIRRISGLLRVSQAWTENSALRFSFFEPNQLQIHLWNGSRGVTLRYYPEFHQSWAAYSTTREPGKPRPASYVLHATSGELYRRSGVGTLELCFQKNTLALVRGDLTILNVPFEGAPQEIYFEGGGLVRGLAFAPSKWTPEPPQPMAVAFRSDRPAELNWEVGKTEGVMLGKLADGRVELRAKEKSPQGQATVSLGGPGFYDIVLEVEDADPGTGIFLSDDQGKHLWRLGFFRHRESGKIAFDLLAPWDGTTERSYDFAKQPVPLAGSRQWFRLTTLGGVARLFTSGDGVSWSPIAPTSGVWDGPCTKLGLYCLQSDQKRAIKLRSLEVRRLETVASLAPAELQRRVPGSLAKVNTIEPWEREVAKGRPDGVEQGAWWRACAIRSLAESPAGVKAAIVDRLLEREFEEGQDPQLLVRLMREAILAYRQEDWDGMDRLIRRANQVGLALVRLQQPSPFTTVNRELLRWPIWHVRRLPVVPDGLLRQELTTLASENRWNEIRSLCQRVRFFNQTGGPREGEQPPWSNHAEYVVNWAESLAAKQSPPSKEEKDAVRRTPVVTDPLIEQLSREGFNTIGELRGALASRAYRDACQLIVSVTDVEKLGLLPDAQDPRLLVAFPVAVESALRASPELRKAMEENHGRVGRLRFRQASATGDAAVMTALAVQFAGGELAAETRRWLGDRALSGGRFLEAIRQYRQAISDAPPAERDALLARSRLAGALMGRDIGQPVKVSVQFGTTRYTAQEFEQMIHQLRQSRENAANEPGEGVRQAVAPGSYEARPWSLVEGRETRRPTNLPDRGLDWVGRCTAVATTAGQMFVNNRVEQTAFDLASAKPQWTQRGVADDNHQRWPLVAMEPVVVGNRLYLRRLTNEGPELVCLQTTDGKVLWSSRIGDGVFSDPLFIGERLYVLAAENAGGKISLNLVDLNPATGSLRMKTLLAEFRDIWRRHFPCQAAVAEDRIVASVGGCALCCDTSGRVIWLRRQIWISPSGFEYYDSREWLDQVHGLPVVVNNSVLLAQPGVWALECVDLQTGRLRWRQSLGNWTRVVGRLGNKFLVQTDDALAMLAVDSGKIRWSRSISDCLDCGLCSSPETVLCVRTGPKKNGGAPEQVVLSWLEASTGKVLGHSAIKLPRQGEWWLKPLIRSDDKGWAFLATVQEPAKREILQLIRVGEMEKSETVELAERR